MHSEINRANNVSLALFTWQFTHTDRHTHSFTLKHTHTLY